jgi:hypothetical protein
MRCWRALLRRPQQIDVRWALLAPRPVASAAPSAHSTARAPPGRAPTAHRRRAGAARCLHAARGARAGRAGAAPRRATLLAPAQLREVLRAVQRAVSQQARRAAAAGVGQRRGRARTLCIIAFSKMNLPSLYFCCSSNACTCAQARPAPRSARPARSAAAGHVAGREEGHIAGWEGGARTYVQPSSAWQFMQKMSATVCRPVMSRRSSLGPSVTFTLRAAHAPPCRVTTALSAGRPRGWLMLRAGERVRGAGICIAAARQVGVSGRAGSERPYTFLNRNARPCRPWNACAIFHIGALELNVIAVHTAATPHSSQGQRTHTGRQQPFFYISRQPSGSTTARCVLTRPAPTDQGVHRRKSGPHRRTLDSISSWSAAWQRQLLQL